MELKKLANNMLIFGVNRFIEIFGVCIVSIGFFLLIYGIKKISQYTLDFRF